MATAVRILLLVFVMLLVGKGNCLGCFPEMVEIKQSKTGAIVDQKPEWKVIVTDRCPCVMYDASLVCLGFKTAEPIDPDVLDKRGDRCVMKRGAPLTDAVIFTYAWDDAYPFTIDPHFKELCE